MTRYNSSEINCFIYSFKDGLLAKLAHDLKMQVESLTFDVDQDSKQVKANFDARTVKVVCRCKNGKDEPGALSSFEVNQINNNIQNNVLESDNHPDIQFRSTSVEPKGDGYFIRGDLTLHGRTKSITTEVKKIDSKYIAEIKLHQPDYGIKPYSAALGALKVQADVVVYISAKIL